MILKKSKNWKREEKKERYYIQQEKNIDAVIINTLVQLSVSCNIKQV